jgi:hypothetical protein
VKIRVWLKSLTNSDIQPCSKISFVAGVGILKTANCGKIPAEP